MSSIYPDTDNGVRAVRIIEGDGDELEEGDDIIIVRGRQWGEEIPAVNHSVYVALGSADSVHGWAGSRGTVTLMINGNQHIFDSQDDIVAMQAVLDAEFGAGNTQATGSGVPNAFFVEFTGTLAGSDQTGAIELVSSDLEQDHTIVLNFGGFNAAEDVFYSPTGGFHTYDFDEETFDIQYNDGPAEVQAAFESVSAIDPGDVTTLAYDGTNGILDQGNYTIVQFTGQYANTQVEQGVPGLFNAVLPSQLTYPPGYDHMGTLGGYSMWQQGGSDPANAAVAVQDQQVGSPATPGSEPTVVTIPAGLSVGSCFTIFNLLPVGEEEQEAFGSAYLMLAEGVSWPTYGSFNPEEGFQLSESSYWIVTLVDEDRIQVWRGQSEYGWD